ncbi:MAG: sulfatase-like hydrolase/transferase [Verrucomicrobiae bacterium]
MKPLLTILAAAALASSALAADAVRPNILWLVAEDANVKWFGCYGSSQATTPNIDKFASEGFRYANAFATAPVCAASRSSWITGVYSLSTGTDPMRSRYDIPHDLIHYYPDELRKAGYFCSNHTKTDYNIGGRPDMECWNSDEIYGWKLRQPGQPFFCVINFMQSHESRAFGSVENTRHDPAQVMLEKYHPDLPTIRKNYALYEDAVENMDKVFGLALSALKKAGLESNTIVIFNTDHGGVMPRSKHYTYDSGLHSPLIVRIPEKYKNMWPAEKPGTVVDRLVSFIDMPKTWLSLAQAPIPDVMQGKIFLGQQTEPEPEYSFSYRGRMDERFDETRVARDKRFIYIKNYMPYVKTGQHHEYLWQMAAMQAWEDYFKAGKTDDITGLFFKTKPCVEELYDCQTDSDCVTNLSTRQEYQPIVARMRQALKDWQLYIHDPGLLPENEMTRRAQANKTTVYQMARDPKLYNLPAYLEASDVALVKNNSNLKTLTGYLADSDSGIRYWGACGMIMQNNLDSAAINALQGCLKDESLDVRAMAAWALIKAGDKKNGQECLIQLLNQESYVTLKVLNIIDWMEVDTTPYLPAIKALKTGKADSLVKNNSKLNPTGDAFARMQDFLLHPDKRPAIDQRGEISKDEDLINKAELNLKDANGKPYDEKLP